ncbi:NAD(P)/FAD-dependent oxidoreductase [Weissella halotolerans]|uniref:NADH:ubiquinone reductase (non-electrogenic) n=1 Tax=Weissella halotolerans DSM 20190 TaxID=1123500 RepID=A0A0R2FVX6_9LACO|nr:NAD(P)/FAD-dependent oxidoreductase [Weissella halotolerans]KRN32376.1 NADH dehydrogenase, FAD-containing subunit [Weissella halotolerans DSM 20190]
MAAKNIVVAGAGFAGVMAARKLAKQLRGTDYQIVLVDKHSFMTYKTELHEVATGRVEPSEVRKDLRTLLKPFSNIKLVTTKITNIDKDAKVVSTMDGDISYEKLVIATGGTTNTFGTPGVEEYGFTLWSYEEAIRLREHIESVVHDGALELDPVKRAAKLSFVVVGSGFTGAELAGELLDQRHGLAVENGLDESEIKIHVVEAAPSILNMLSDRKLADKAQAYFEEHDVTIQESTAVVEVKESAAVLKDGSEIPTETLIWTAGVKAKPQGAKWNLEQGPGGRFMTDQYSRAVGEDDIYVVGDVAAYREPDLIVEDNPRSGWTPQTVEGGESAVNTAVPNIVFDLTGKGQRVDFKGRYQGYAVSIGSHYAVAVLDQIGNVKIGKKGLSMSGFFANMFKYIINIYWYLQVHSWYYLGHYLRDEFFETPDGRNPFYGWTSRNANVLFSLPLRFIVGLTWMSLGQGQPFYGTWVGTVEIIIGWLIVFGMFTSVAGFIGVLIGLYLTIQSGSEVMALIFAASSLAIMNGSGRVLGVDFWLMPYLERKFDLLLHGKEKTIYNDLGKK